MNAPATPPDETPAMRMPRLRFTVRRLMLVVVIVGLGTGSIVFKSRAEAFRRKANEFRLYSALYTPAASKIRGYIDVIQATESDATTQIAARNLEGYILMVRVNRGLQLSKHENARRFAPLIPPERIAMLPCLGREAASWCSEVITWGDSLAQKYERAARYPWLPITPDPPAPK